LGVGRAGWLAGWSQCSVSITHQPQPSLTPARPRHAPRPPPPAPAPLRFEDRTFPLTQRELEAAVALLQLMAESLPLQLVRVDVVALLTCHQPFVDLPHSDQSARAAVLSGAFRLLHVLARRAGPGGAVVGVLCGRLGKMLGQLVDEYEGVMRLKGSPQDFTQVGVLIRACHGAGGESKQRACTCAATIKLLFYPPHPTPNQTKPNQTTTGA